MSRLARILATTGTVVATAALAAVGLTGVATAAPVAAPALAPATVPAPACDPGKLCVWEDPYFGGTRHDFVYCGDPFPVGAVTPPLRRVGSFVNNQTPGTVAHFYGDRNGHREYSSTAYEEVRDATTDVDATFVDLC